MPVAVGAFPLTTSSRVCGMLLTGAGAEGDAAHTIHPLAGRGVSTGYRDVDALIDVLASAVA